MLPPWSAPAARGGPAAENDGFAMFRVLVLLRLVSPRLDPSLPRRRLGIIHGSDVRGPRILRPGFIPSLRGPKVGGGENRPALVSLLFSARVLRRKSDRVLGFRLVVRSAARSRNGAGGGAALYVDGGAV